MAYFNCSSIVNLQMETWVGMQYILKHCLSMALCSIHAMLQLMIALVSFSFFSLRKLLGLTFTQRSKLISILIKVKDTALPYLLSVCATVYFINSSLLLLFPCLESTCNSLNSNKTLILLFGCPTLLMSIIFQRLLVDVTLNFCLFYFQIWILWRCHYREWKITLDGA